MWVNLTLHVDQRGSVLVPFANTMRDKRLPKSPTRLIEDPNTPKKTASKEVNSTASRQRVALTAEDSKSQKECSMTDTEVEEEEEKAVEAAEPLDEVIDGRTDEEKEDDDNDGNVSVAMNMLW